MRERQQTDLLYKAATCCLLLKDREFIFNIHKAVRELSESGRKKVKKVKMLL